MACVITTIYLLLHLHETLLIAPCTWGWTPHGEMLVTRFFCCLVDYWRRLKGSVTLWHLVANSVDSRLKPVDWSIGLLICCRRLQRGCGNLVQLLRILVLYYIWYKL